MAFWYYEGTKDYLVQGVPAVVLTFKASGSITAGRFVALDAGGTSDVYQPTAEINTCDKAVGVAMHTASDDDPVAVLCWGVAKNLSFANSSETVTPGCMVTVSGSGQLTSGSAYIVGRILSGSATRLMCFVDCMKVFTSD